MWAGLMFQPVRTGLFPGYCAEHSNQRIIIRCLGGYCALHSNHLIIFHLLQNVNCSRSACKWRRTKNGQQRGRKVTWNEGVRWLGRRWLAVAGAAAAVFCFKRHRERPESERSRFFPSLCFLPYFLLYFPLFLISLFLYKKKPFCFSLPVSPFSLKNCRFLSLGLPPFLFCFDFPSVVAGGSCCWRHCW